MNEQEHVTVGEFTRLTQSLERQIQMGFDGVHSRMDRYEARQDRHTSEISALNERTKSANRSAGIRGATWGSIITGVAALIQYLTAAWKGGN